MGQVEESVQEGPWSPEEQGSVQSGRKPRHKTPVACKHQVPSPLEWAREAPGYGSNGGSLQLCLPEEEVSLWPP